MAAIAICQSTRNTDARLRFRDHRQDPIPAGTVQPGPDAACVHLHDHDQEHRHGRGPADLAPLGHHRRQRQGRRKCSGLGVVGHQPLLQPGEQFEYTSGTPLETPQGSMVGEYFFVAEDGTASRSRSRSSCCRCRTPCTEAMHCGRSSGGWLVARRASRAGRGLRGVLLRLRGPRTSSTRR